MPDTFFTAHMKLTCGHYYAYFADKETALRGEMFWAFSSFMDSLFKDNLTYATKLLFVWPKPWKRKIISSITYFQRQLVAQKRGISSTGERERPAGSKGSFGLPCGHNLPHNPPKSSLLPFLPLLNLIPINKTDKARVVKKVCEQPEILS